MPNYAYAGIPVAVTVVTEILNCEDEGKIEVKKLSDFNAEIKAYHFYGPFCLIPATTYYDTFTYNVEIIFPTPGKGTIKFIGHPELSGTFTRSLTVYP